MVQLIERYVNGVLEWQCDHCQIWKPKGEFDVKRGQFGNQECKLCLGQKVPQKEKSREGFSTYSSYVNEKNRIKRELARLRLEYETKRDAIKAECVRVEQEYRNDILSKGAKLS